MDVNYILGNDLIDFIDLNIVVILIFNFLSGILVSGVMVEIVLVILGVIIYYIIDGSDLINVLMEYFGIVIILEDGIVVLKVLVVLDGYSDSIISIVNYMVSIVFIVLVLLIIEVENVDFIIFGVMDGFLWNIILCDGVFEGYVIQVFDIDVKNDISEENIRVDYIINVMVFGIYYVWMRGLVIFGNCFFYIGLDGIWVVNFDYFCFFNVGQGDWIWVEGLALIGLIIFEFIVGICIFNLWMRRLNLIID